MPAPQPKDPLDDPIARFVTAVNDFLVIRADVGPPPTRSRTQNPIDDLMRNWEALKAHLRKCHAALVGAEPEVDERLQRIVSVGNEILDLTDDVLITTPVQDLVRMASEERNEIRNVIARLGDATSVPTVLALVGELVGVSSRTKERHLQIARTLDALTAYFLIRMPPQDSA